MIDLPVLKLIQSDCIQTEDINYLHNAYLLVKELDDQTLRVERSVTTCRDTFLRDVYNKFSEEGADSVTIALILCDGYMESGKLDLTNIFVELNWMRLEAIIYLSVGVWDEDTGKKSIGRFPALVLSVTREQYRNPAAFWITTEKLRWTTCQYSKVPRDGRDHILPEYHYVYSQLLSNERVIPEILPILGSEFYRIHSPLGVVQYTYQLALAYAEEQSAIVRRRSGKPFTNDPLVPKFLSLYGNLKMFYYSGVSSPPLNELFKLEK